VTSVYQEFTVDASYNGGGVQTQFWAFNPRFSIASGFYIGVQRAGLLWGPGVYGQKVDYNAQFSLFSPPNHTSSRLMLDTTNCAYGADTSDGITCGIRYNWATGQRFRLTVNIYSGISTPGWCPPAASTCTVYQGMIAPANNLSAATQISAWSIAPSVYGIVNIAQSFLENLNAFHHQYCAPLNNVAGTFVVPFKVNGTASPYPIDHAWAVDETQIDHTQSPAVPVPECAWLWRSGVISYMTY
jgi:hypothetical protein